jgi:hypothetical protein
VIDKKIVCSFRKKGILFFYQAAFKSVLMNTAGMLTTSGYQAALSKIGIK